jgi:hypothetical protein
MLEPSIVKIQHIVARMFLSPMMNLLLEGFSIYEILFYCFGAKFFLSSGEDTFWL